MIKPCRVGSAARPRRGDGNVFDGLLATKRRNLIRKGTEMKTGSCHFERLTREFKLLLGWEQVLVRDTWQRRGGFLGMRRGIDNRRYK